jgi:8-amino-7-oxononanoate synthase
MKERLHKRLQKIKAAGNYREIKYIKPISATRILYDGREYLNLCSNSYLSLHVHPEVMRAAAEAIGEYGAGTCSSRSVSGSIDSYRGLEVEVAAFKQYGRALIFPNGYMANIGIISTLTDEWDVIFTDELNHSSLIDSTRLSRAKKVVYRHLDMADLEKKIRNERTGGKKFVVTETVFSMDGDVAPLGELHRLKEKYGLHVVVDEAHATGVFGPAGIGVEEVFGVTGKMDVQMGTFGKALGSFGAFVLSDDVTIDYLVNRARTFMYTTALPASTLAASRQALRLVSSDRSYKDELWDNVRRMREGLLGMGFDLKESQGPIIPIVVGDDHKAVEAQRRLMERGIFLQAIRPPTVPSGTARLRLTVIRDLTPQDIEYSLDAIGAVGREMGLIQ